MQTSEFVTKPIFGMAIAAGLECIENDKKRIKKMFKFKMRDRVKDIITGYEGVITVRTEYMNGCIQYCVKKTELDKNGKIQEGEFFDEGELKVVKKTKAVEPSKRRGGPQRDQAPESPV